MPKFQPGTVVQLKSGGPLMTVKQDRGDDQIVCEWFDSKQEPQARAFAAASLEVYNSGQGFA